ncbi:DMT family transporter [Alkalicoccus daliensis]|uniref:Threonine/homoserine efflux transporter RhtA n=1 Tax=Alkalicoccus daliensis TaxID=745820 RepID=A0A1H0GVW4_9BACI|nr:DMT family transporter [Alkalicoccus daliensis]SDO11186.1 Threonine/homoserine efflux transporter RhtA [Alkalicoccus daliensis]
MEEPKPQPIGLLLTISIIAISFAAIFVKWSDAPATIISMYRMFLAALLLLPIIFVKREQLYRLKGRDFIILTFSGVFLALHFALWFGSLKLTTVASSTIILALQPIIALAGGYLIYKERTDFFTVATISISFVGIVIIGIGDLGLSRAHLIGDLLSFLSVIAIVAYLLIGQSTVKKISHWIYSFCVFLIAGIALMIYNIITAVPLGGYDAGEWRIFILLAVFPTIAHVIYNLLLNYVNTSTISMSILGEPVGATILAVLLLGETVTLMQISGGFLVLLGVYLFLRR